MNTTTAAALFWIRDWNLNLLGTIALGTDEVTGMAPTSWDAAAAWERQAGAGTVIAVPVTAERAAKVAAEVSALIGKAA